MTGHHTPPKLQVPALIMTPADVSRLRRELNSLDDYMRQQVLREKGQPSARLPKVSRVLDELAAANGLNLLEASTREHLIGFLTDIAANAPIVDVSFVVDPSSAFLQKIVQWFRQNIHPSILIRVGLQPNIAAGCIVRTTNRYYDLSLRQYLQSHRSLLLDALNQAATQRETPSAHPAVDPAEAVRPMMAPDPVAAAPISSVASAVVPASGTQPHGVER